MHSKDKGSLGEVSVAKELLSKNYPVFVEYGDNSKIDIVTFRDDKAVTIQVKAVPKIGGSIRVRAIKNGPNGYKYLYKYSDFDLFAVYCMCNDTTYYVPLGLVLRNKNEITLRVDDLKISSRHKVRYADDYRSFEKAIQYLSMNELEKSFAYSTAVRT